jgi:hypothetical protein
MAGVCSNGCSLSTEHAEASTPRTSLDIGQFAAASGAVTSAQLVKLSNSDGTTLASRRQSVVIPMTTSDVSEAFFGWRPKLAAERRLI